MQACSNKPSIELKHAQWKEPRRGTSKHVAADAHSHQRAAMVNSVPLLCYTFIPAGTAVCFSFALVGSCQIRALIYSLKFRFTQTCKGNQTHMPPQFAQCPVFL